jgi:hypothetical protein
MPAPQNQQCLLKEAIESELQCIHSCLNPTSAACSSSGWAKVTLLEVGVAKMGKVQSLLCAEVKGYQAGNRDRFLSSGSPRSVQRFGFHSSFNTLSCYSPHAKPRDIWNTKSEDLT